MYLALGYMHIKSYTSRLQGSLLHTHARRTRVHPLQLLRVQLHRRSTSLWSVALTLVVRPVTSSRGSTALPLDLFFGRTGSTSTLSCAATTHHPAAQALRQPRRAPRVLVFLSQRLYIDYAVRCRDVVFWVYDYLDYLPRLVSTRKLVEDGSRDINN
jgi:hypothetical protein